MLGRWLGRTSVIALTLLGGGCGTLVNTTSYAPDEVNPGQRRIYGGVVWDLRGEYRALTTPFPHYFLGINPPMIIAYLLDLPLSAIGDTITLPITIGEALGISLPPVPSPPEMTFGSMPPPPVSTGQLPPPREVGPDSKEPPVNR
ncbi:MAG TPA: hypothetical protein VHR66_17080 [Gemmataceae bacterium]|jgi:uncharacterized protein YceK|nr:hypothetical protein [Gemmataceae bacterium]